jgi:hypothetical protein
MNGASTGKFYISSHDLPCVGFVKHSLGKRDVTVHVGPVKLEADPMKGARCIKMPLKGVAVAGNKDNVA